MFNRLRRMMALITVMSLLGLLLAACGGGGQTGAEQNPAVSAAASAGGATGAGASAAASPATTGGTGGASAAASPATTGGTGGASAAASPGVAGGASAAASPGGAAGGASAAASPGGAAGGGQAITLPAECTNVELQYWNPFTGPDGPFMGQLVDQFNTDNPNIVVTMTSQGEYYTQLGTAAASNTLPDVAIVHADQVATQAFRNIIRPIDDLAGQMGVSAANFPEPVWNAGEVNGKRYSIPLDIHPMTMFYNADLFQSAGIANPPKTREEFEQAAQALTSGDNNGFMITAGFPIQQIFSMLLYQNGGSWFNEDGTKAAWNSPEGVEVLQYLKDVQGKYSQPNLEVDAELNAFKGGTVGMVWNGIWQTTNLTGEGVGFNGQTAAVPQIFEKPAVWAGSHQLTRPVSQNADPCKDAAVGIFMRYLLDNSETWARAGQVPASNEVRESIAAAGGNAAAAGSPAASGDASSGTLPNPELARSVENAIFPPSVPGITDAFAPLEEAVIAVMSGNATDIQAALNDAASRADQILAENAANYGTAPKQ